MWSVWILFLAVLCIPPGIATGQSCAVELQLDPAALDRVHSPCVAKVALPVAFSPQSAYVELEGKKIPAQVTRVSSVTAPPNGGSPTEREVHFIVPALKAGQPVQARLTVTQGDVPPPQFVWHDNENKASDLRFGDQKVLRYVCESLDDSTKERREQTIKPFHHLYDPEGEKLLTKGPGGLYTHHRGMFFGFNKISYGAHKDVDVWHCHGDAHQSHQEHLAREAGPVMARHSVAIHWHGPKKEVFARELREVTVWRLPGGNLIDFKSELTPVGGPVKLNGDPQHAGFHFRAAQEVADDTKQQTYFLRPDGPGKPGETRNWEPKTRQGPVDLPWNAMSFVLGDQRYTVAYLDRAANPKEARFSERDYGRFGSYFEYEVRNDKPLRVHYRLWLQRGEMQPPAVARLRADLATPIAVTPR